MRWDRPAVRLAEVCHSPSKRFRHRQPIFSRRPPIRDRPKHGQCSAAGNLGSAEAIGFELFHLGLIDGRLAPYSKTGGWWLRAGLFHALVLIDAVTV
jgi:hypothetical protein